MLQRSDEWYATKLGKVSSSRIADLMAKIKSGGSSASRANYLAELALERLTGVTQDGFESPAMIWGRETEPAARAAYCFNNDVDVEEVGFIDHPTVPLTGCSPDGLVGATGLVEIKCPNPATHMETLLSKSIPQKYSLQMQFQMWVTGREFCDYVSFDPRFPVEMRYWQSHVQRHDATIKTIAQEVADFQADLDIKLRTLRDLYQ